MENEDVKSEDQEELLKEWRELNKKIDSKLLQDEYRENIINNLHQQLEIYQNDAIAASVMPVMMDLIDMADRIRRSMKFYPEDGGAEQYAKLRRMYMGMIDDLQEIMKRQQIDAFEYKEGRFDARYQHIVETVSTDDEGLDGSVAETLGCGYMRNEKILRRQNVNVYKYEAGSNKK